MADVSTAVTTIKSNVKSTVAVIDGQIKELNKIRTALLSAIGSDEASTSAAVAKAPRKPRTAKAASAPASSNGQEKPGMLATALPFMEDKAEVTSAQIAEYLQGHGFANLRRASLDAALANEVKKGAKARVERTAPGRYRCSPAYFDSRPMRDGAPPAAEASVPEPAPEPVTA